MFPLDPDQRYILFTRLKVLVHFLAFYFRPDIEPQAEDEEATFRHEAGSESMA